MEQDSAHRRGRQAERPADRRLAVPGRGRGCDGRIPLPPGGARVAGPQDSAIPFGQAAPDTVHDPIAEGVVQALLSDRACRADPPGGLGRFAAAGKKPLQVSAAARSPVTPAGRERRWRSRGAVTRRARRHRAGAVTRARQAAAKAARSAVSRPLAANSSANRLGYRRVVLRVPRQTTVCGSAPTIASRRTVSRETPSRCASCAAVRKSEV
jgi:hypothetical protein